MKKIFLTVLISLGLLASAYGGLIVDLPLKTDLVDKKGSLGTGAFARSSAATYIHDGVLYTADGDDTPFSNASIENEAGATEMRGSFVDGQAWFHDAGGLIAVYADTGNLLIAYDGAGVGYAYGFLGEVGTGEVATPLANNVTAISKANPGVVSSVAHGLGIGDLVYFDSLTEMTELNTKYKVVTAVGSADLFSINDTSGYTNAEVTGGACAHEVTEPGANAVHIYKEYGLLNEGWNAIDTGIDFNAGAAWDFDVYVNLMTSAGGTAQPRFQDGRFLFEGEETNLITYSEDFSQWTPVRAGLDTSEADPRGGTGATGLVSTAEENNHYLYARPTFSDDVDVTYSIFVKAGDKDWIVMYFVLKDSLAPYCYFQLSGAGATGTNITTKESVERLGTTDWYRCRITHNISNGATVPEVRIYSAEGDFDNSFTGDGTTIDTYVYGADAKQDLFLTSYIPTNGIPVTRTTEAATATDGGVSWTIPVHGALDNSLSDSNPPAAPTDANGTLMFTVRHLYDESDIAAADNGLVSVGDAAEDLAYFDADSFDAHDGTLDSTYNHPAFVAGDEITYVVRWGDVDGETDDISVGYTADDGATWVFDATPANFDLDWGVVTELRLGFDLLYPMEFSDLKIWDVAYTQAQIAAGLERNMLLWMLPFEFP